MNMMKMASIEEAAHVAWENKGALQASIVKASNKDAAFMHYYLGFLAGCRHEAAKAAAPDTGPLEDELEGLKEDLRYIAKYAGDMNWRSISKIATKALTTLVQATNEEKNEKDNQA